MVRQNETVAIINFFTPPKTKILIMDEDQPGLPQYYTAAKI
jgi:hypothetical protein